MRIEQLPAELREGVFHIEPVQGGDINRAWKLVRKGSLLFLKQNSTRFRGMFAAEALGLETLKAAGTLKVPDVLYVSEEGNHQWLALEWLYAGTNGAAEQYAFGESLAQMHKPAAPYFGFGSTNYIGSLLQPNEPMDSWSGFYTHQRILPMVRKLLDMGRINPNDMRTAERLCTGLHEHFDEEAPSLLHGDLWGGNYMMSNRGPAVFDPAVYYGHREMDMAMSRLFGGFGRAFYEGYQHVYPLRDGWEERIRLWQLYPLLVHALLFGGSYTRQAMDVVRAYTD